MKRTPTILLSVMFALLIISSFSIVNARIIHSDNFTGSFQSFWGADIGTSPVISGNTMYSTVSLGDGAQSAKTYSGVTLGADGTISFNFDMKCNTFSSAGAGSAVEMFLLVSDTDTTGTNGYVAVIVDGSGKFGLWLGKYPDFVLHYSEITPTTNTWYNVNLTLDNTNDQIRLDINGTNAMTEPYALHFNFGSANTVQGTFGIVYNYNTVGINANFDNFKISDATTEATPTPTPPTPTPMSGEPLNENIIVGLVIAFFFVIFNTIFLFAKPCLEIMVLSLVVMAFTIIIGALIVIPISQIIGVFMIVYSVFVFFITVLRVQV